MIKLSKRLQTISSLVDTYKVFDIGTDHGYLAIHLSSNHKVIATDISRNIVDKLKDKTKDISNIEVICTDGLQGLDIDYNNTIVIAGMGMKTIADILVEPLPNNIVIDSHNDLEQLRKHMVKIGYYIDKEVVVHENNRYYVIIKFKKGHIVYTDIEYMIGVFTKHDKNYMQFLFDVYSKAIVNMKDLVKKAKYQKAIDFIKGLSDNT